MYASRVDWDLVAKRVHAEAAGARNLTELRPALSELITGIGDYHGRVVRSTDYSNMAWFGGDWPEIPRRQAVDRETYSATWDAVNQPDARFSYATLSGGVGYLKIVGVGANVEHAAEAARIRQALVDLKAAGVDRWVVDLRYNGGGNSNVMLTGVAPLLGEGVVASIVDLEGRPMGGAEVRAGAFSYFGYQLAELPNEPAISSEEKVAILTSRYTVSSGELVAVALKGRPNTRFFGEATGGLTTNTGWEVIADSVILVISTGVFADREGTPYPQTVPVDEEVAFVVETDPTRDAGIQAALRWLNE